MTTPSLYTRRQTRAVFVGQVGVGGRFPIRIQSMLTSDTKNTTSVIQEIKDLLAAGCEIIRLTVPTKADLENLQHIRAVMRKENLKVPLVADIHFTPSIALDAVDYVEKVRINPGNYADKKLFQKHEYSDADYANELARIAEKFIPLVRKCKERGVAMRIGTNHGSLSDRILSRYGDTPQGMVESALEFLRIAESQHYYDIVLSMKASNVQVMVTAYRLLAKRLAEENLQPYPFHLGVTEAGDGEDARIKSAMGTGLLLHEGLGDTIRVSLTEDSVHEIPVAYAIASPYNQSFAENLHLQNSTPWSSPAFRTTYQRHTTTKLSLGPAAFGGAETVRVWASLGEMGFDHACFAKNSDPAFEGVEFTPAQATPDALNELLRQERALGLISRHANELHTEFCWHKRSWIVQNPPSAHELTELIAVCQKQNCLLEFCVETQNSAWPDWLSSIDRALKKQNFTKVCFSLLSHSPLHDYKILAQTLTSLRRLDPLHLRFISPTRNLQIATSIQLGGLLLDGLGDSVQIMRPDVAYPELLSLSYGILQASRVRMSKTEYIACPSCGRTTFHLQDVTAKIKARTHHLKGVKIGIMGCIVNGPGEMADADFGYVGTGAGKISLYVGQNCVERNLPESEAVDRLIGLIQEHGRWVENTI